MSKFNRSDLDFARDELMSHVHRCGVLQADAEQQEVWLDDTMGYMAERFPALTPLELAELRTIGARFCAPVIPHGKQHTALTADDEGYQESSEDYQEADADAEDREMVGAA